MIQGSIPDKIAATATVAGGTVTAYVSIEVVNEYLQAGAFLVAIMSGIAATIYYLSKRKK